MKKLTAAQWRWLAHQHPRTRKKVWLAARTATIFVVLSAIVLFALHGNQLGYESSASMKNLALGITIIYAIFLTFLNFVILIVIITWFVYEQEKDEIKRERSMFDSVKSFGGMIRRPGFGELCHTLMLRGVNALEYVTIIGIIAYGWIVWGICLFIGCSLSDLLGFFMRMLMREFVVRCNPEKLQALGGSESVFIVTELLRDLREEIQIGQLETVVKDSCAEVKIPLVDAPQTNLRIVLSQERIELNEQHYGQAVEHLKADLSQPNSLQSILDKLESIAVKRIQEAQN